MARRFAKAHVALVLFVVDDDDDDDVGSVRERQRLTRSRQMSVAWS
jgi:hypothetical protein